MSDSKLMQIDQSGGVLRITIPFGTREKAWMSVALTVMLLFGTMMSLIAEFALHSVTQIHALYVLPFVVLTAIVGIYFLSLIAVRSATGKMVVFDGNTIAVGDIGSPPRQSWPREKIKSLSVSRLPLVPVANLVIMVKGESNYRAGVYRKRDLEAAAVKLREAIAAARAIQGTEGAES